jgi:uncharacterized protein with LGFP repeats
MTLTASAPVSQRLVDRAAGFLAARSTRRGFLARTAVVGSALAVSPAAFVLRPVTAYAAVCGPGADCASGWTAFCCTTSGANTCPPGTFVGGWWKADASSFCCGGPRYYIDCQNMCTGCSAGCGGYNSFCSSGCINGSCHCASGSCDQRRVSCNYFRYGQCHQEVACGGPVACRMVSCTPPYQLFAECSNASATDNATAEHSAPCLPGGCAGAIEQHYYDLGGPAGFLGAPQTGELPTPDGVGRFTHYEYGSIYWTPATDAWEVHGRIRDLWAGLGWERSFLGYPVTDELPTPNGRGRFNHFQGGSIYWSPATGPHEVHGGIRSVWAAHGWEAGVLGFPVTDELPGRDGQGRYNHFEGGSVYWSPATGGHEVHGEIRNAWARLGWELSFLGYPVTDELPTPDGRGRFNHFQGGSIYWSPGSGAHEVHGGIRGAWAALGWEAGRLGYPVTDEHDIAGGRASDFEHGRISWDAATGQTTVSYS